MTGSVASTGGRTKFVLVKLWKDCWSFVQQRSMIERERRTRVKRERK
jgi:hypothetical protein